MHLNYPKLMKNTVAPYAVFSSQLKKCVGPRPRVRLCDSLLLDAGTPFVTFPHPLVLLHTPVAPFEVW